MRVVSRQPASCRGRRFGHAMKRRRHVELFSLSGLSVHHLRVMLHCATTTRWRRQDADADATITTDVSVGSWLTRRDSLPIRRSRDGKTASMGRRSSALALVKARRLTRATSSLHHARRTTGRCRMPSDRSTARKVSIGIFGASVT